MKVEKYLIDENSTVYELILVNLHKDGFTLKYKKGKKIRDYKGLYLGERVKIE